MSEATSTPVIRMSLSREVAQGHQLILETYIGNDEPPKAVHALLDKLSDAVDRQAAKAELPHLRKLLTEHEEAAKRGHEDMARIDAAYSDRAAAAVGAGRRQPAELSSKEKIDRENAQTKIERWKEEALKLRSMIAEREKVVEGSGG